MAASHSKHIETDISVLDWGKTGKGRMAPSLLTDSGGCGLLGKESAVEGRGAVSVPSASVYTLQRLRAVPGNRWETLHLGLHVLLQVLLHSFPYVEKPLCPFL